MRRHCSDNCCAASFFIMVIQSPGVKKDFASVSPSVYVPLRRIEFGFIMRRRKKNFFFLYQYVLRQITA